MNHHPEPTLAPMARKIENWQPLSDEDRAAVLDLPCSRRTIEPHQKLVWEGEKPTHCCVLLSGYAFRQKAAGHGGRQILSIHLPGDIVDLQNSLLGIADHDVQALTRVVAAAIPVDAVRKLAFDRPAVGMAMWYDTLVEGSIFREWTLNIGRRDARTRIAHLLCEFAVRMNAAGLSGPNEYELPMTQEQLADATGLTAVHVNRSLMALEAAGLIDRVRRTIRIAAFEKLAKAGDFHPRYLHLDGPPPAAP